MAKLQKKSRALVFSFIIAFQICACGDQLLLASLRNFLNTQVPAAEHVTRPDDSVPVEETKEIAPLHIIWDDDGSPDGMIALMYLLKHPSVQVEAVTVTAGEAFPQTFAPLMARALEKINHTGIPIGYGRDEPLSGNNAFPDPWRVATNVFWEIQLPEASAEHEILPAPDLIVRTLNEADAPVTFFLSGTHTNLAEALALDPAIAAKIAAVHVMGGALFVPGNIASDWPENPNATAEWNIYVDPVAADQVFSAGLPLFLTPLDATNSVIWKKEDARRWEKGGSPEGQMASELLTWMLNAWFPEGVYAWDVVAAVNMLKPDLCKSDPFSVQVITGAGENEGQTVVLEDAKPNLSACIEPDSDAMRSEVARVFSQ